MHKLEKKAFSNSKLTFSAQLASSKKKTHSHQSILPPKEQLSSISLTALTLYLLSFIVI